MHDTEKILAFAARVRQMAATLKSMSVTIEDSEMAMALLNGLPDRFDSLISALDATHTDDKDLTFELVQSRCLQEEQRHAQRDQDALKRSEAAALFATGSSKQRKSASTETCVHCGKHRDSSKCYFKYPHLAPQGHPARARLDNVKKDSKALVAQTPPDTQLPPENDYVCLLGVPPAHEVALQSSQHMASSSTHWIIDSGCTSHVTHDRSVFTSYTAATTTSCLDLGANSSAPIVGRGDVKLNLCLPNGETKPCLVKNVLHVPDLRYQLLSVSAMAKLGVNVQFDESRALLVRDSNTIATGTFRNGLYTLDCTKPPVQAPSDNPDTALVASLKIWHKRLAHASVSGIKSMVARGVVKGIDIPPKNPDFDCEGCVLGKSHRTAIPKISNSRASQPLELVHSDVCGPIETESVGGARYFVSFIDDYSKWTVVYFMRRKSEVLECFKLFRALAEKHTSTVIGKLHVQEFHGIDEKQTNELALKVLRSDNGGEYLSNSFKDFLSQNGIQHQLTVAYTPQQNGVAERMNRTLLDLVRSMLHDKSLPKKFWAEALATAVYVRNRVTSRSLPSNTTPYHIWFGKAPDLSHMRVFGSQCWYVLPKKDVKKLDARTREALMMGYSSQSKGYKLWDGDAGKFVVSRDVTFNEKSSNDCQELSDADLQHDLSSELTLKDETAPEPAHAKDNLDKEEHLSLEESDPVVENDEPSPASDPAPAPRRSSRVSKKPGNWWVANIATTPTPDVSLLATCCDSPAEVALLAPEIPSTYAEAMSPDNKDFWEPGIKKEEDSIKANNTFELVERQPHMNVIPCRYVFRVKKDVGPKVRIVAKGFRQVPGVDYNETYAPVVSLSIVRLFLCLVNLLDLECDQMDVVTAFLNGDLDEEIFMEVPAGFRDPSRPNLVCRLLKALYGLKQAPRQWYAKIHRFLTSILKFISSAYEPCLYIFSTGQILLIIILYVDDLLIAGNDRKEILRVKKELMKVFKMKDLGGVQEFLGIEVTRNRGNRTLRLSQSSYIAKILERFQMSDSSPTATPMAQQSSKPPSDDSKPLSDDVPYRSAIGSLMYLMICTRPDLGFAVGRLSQYCEHPLKMHWNAVKRIYRYIKGTQDMGIVYDAKSTPSSETSVIGYCDSDWAGCSDSRKSTEAYVFLLTGGAISWRSKKQSIVALSSCEAEYISACTAAKEAIWLSNVLQNLLGTKSPSPITVLMDNQGSIKSAQNTSINARNKHIDIRHHFVREAVAKKEVALAYCPTTDQVADILTKPLLRVLFQKFRSLMGIC